MPEGLYSTTDLRRWLKRLCEIQDRGPSDWQPSVMVQRLLLDVMDALSRRAPRCSVRLDHLQEFEQEGMRDEKVEALRGHVAGGSADPGNRRVARLWTVATG